MNLDFFSTNSLLEQEYILKYFYLLDPQAIATEVHAELEQKGDSRIRYWFWEYWALFPYTLSPCIYPCLSIRKIYSYKWNSKIPFLENQQMTIKRSIKILNHYFLRWLHFSSFLLYNYCISEGFFHYLEQDYFYNDPKRCSAFICKIWRLF